MVVQLGVPGSAIEAFLSSLGRRGRGSYTQRSYRLGLTDFSRWLTVHGLALDEVVRRDVEAYVDEFARGQERGNRVARRSGVVDLATGQPVRQLGRAPRTVNHRLSVLASFFGFLIEQDTESGGVWAGRMNPVPQNSFGELVHGMPGGGDPPPKRGRAELRRREPRELPAVLDPAVVRRLIDGAISWRDKALLLLLARTGQRIGDWSQQHGRHGVLGMSLTDLDRRTSTVVVRLKGARDEHRVPVTAEFWAAFDAYLEHERGDPPTEAVWVGLRRGRGRPLSYAAFEAGLRHLGRKVGVKVTAHMFRHTVATAVVQTAGVVVAQELLGHRHLGTTIDTYAPEKLYPTELVNEYRKAMRGLYGDVYGPDAAMTPTAADWEAFTTSCSLRDMGTHICALPTGEHCPRGLVCLGCSHAQPKKSAVPTFRRMLTSHTRALERAREHGEPAGQIAARELEVERIQAAMQRAQELTGDAADALEAAAV